MRMRTCVACVALALASGCSSLGDDPFPNAIDGGVPDARPDARAGDAAPVDAAPMDAARPDASPPDAGPPDATALDASELDATAANDTFGRMPSFTRHLFICVNERPAGNPKGCCKESGGAEVRDTFKKCLAAAGLHGAVRANKSGCLDQCAVGVVVVVYPEQVWYGHVTVGDVQEIVDSHILGGQFVTRLMLPDQQHLRGATSGPRLHVPRRRPDDETA